MGRHRFLWPVFALPGTAWLVLFFLIPFYAVLSVAFGTVDPIFQGPVPAWNPLDWNFDTMRSVLEQLRVISGSPGTSMIGNQINLFFQGGPQRTTGAALVIVLALLLAGLMSYYLVATARASRQPATA